jgi:hypothetical protein
MITQFIVGDCLENSISLNKLIQVLDNIDEQDAENGSGRVFITKAEYDGFYQISIFSNPFMDNE